MTAGDAQVPEAVEAIDAATIDAIVGRRRSELARLSLAARTATQRRERAEAALASQPEIGHDGIPSELLTVVDAMLDKAVRASEIGLDAAWREASVLVASAVSASAEALRRSGLDPSVVPVAARPVEAAPRLTPPPTAAELWRGLRVPTASVPAPTPPSAPAPAVSLPVDGRAPEPRVPFAPDASVSPAVADRVGEPMAPTPAVTTLLLDAPVAEPGQDGSADVYDIFWQEVPGERRVRDRLLRRSPKEGA